MGQIDARGQACPLPVVRAKKALSAMGEGVLEVLVDNETAVHNLEALAKTLKVEAVGEKRGEDTFAVTFSKGAAASDGQAGSAASCPAVDPAPETVLMYNGGVKLACTGSSSLDDLRTLAEAGVEIMSCGTCLNHYGLAEQLEVGEATNMYVIVEKQASARGIIRP